MSYLLNLKQDTHTLNHNIQHKKNLEIMFHIVMLNIWYIPIFWARQVWLPVWRVASMFKVIGGEFYERHELCPLCLLDDEPAIHFRLEQIKLLLFPP